MGNSGVRSACEPRAVCSLLEETGLSSHGLLAVKCKSEVTSGTTESSKPALNCKDMSLDRIFPSFFLVFRHCWVSLQFQEIICESWHTPPKDEGRNALRLHRRDGSLVGGRGLPPSSPRSVGSSFTRLRCGLPCWSASLKLFLEWL